MGIVLWILFGVVAGAVARRVMPGPSAGGTSVAILVGITGGLIGGLVGTFFVGAMSMAVDGRSLLMAVFGTVIFLFSYRCFAMRAAF